MNNLKISNNKIARLKNIINKTILSCQKYKLYDILGANEVNICITTLDLLFNDIKNENTIDNNTIEKIYNELLLIVKNFGTDNLGDLVYLLFGDDDYPNYVNQKNYQINS